MDQNVILKLEKLARLKLNEDERVQFSSDMESMVNMIEKLKEVDTSGIEPLYEINEDSALPRNDKSGQNMDSDQALKNANEKKPPYFIVPNVLKST